MSLNFYVDTRKGALVASADIDGMYWREEIPLDLRKAVNRRLRGEAENDE